MISTMYTWPRDTGKNEGRKSAGILVVANQPQVTLTLSPNPTDNIWPGGAPRAT